MPGKLYLANLSISPVQYTINDLSGPEDLGADPENYTPSLWFVNRVLQRDKRAPSFFQGPGNKLRTEFQDVRSGEKPSHHFTIAIPGPPVSVDDDLILYVFREQVLLMDTRGNQLAWVQEDS